MKIADKILSSVKVRFYKKEKDNRVSLCGEPLQVDEDGREFFEIPAHQADYIKAILTNYEMQEEAIEIDIKKKPKKQEG